MNSFRLTTAHSRNRTLVIMAKAPRPGRVKTRLMESLPGAAVTALYRCLLEDTLDLARSLNEVEIAIMCPRADVDDLIDVTGNAVQVVAQNGEGLAAGLISVFAHFAVEQRCVIAFNSDSPHLPAAVLKNAFESLTVRDVVIGPTHDGGYYLVGAKAAYPTLFAGDGLGTTSALETLRARVQRLGLSAGFTDIFYDIDVSGDLLRLAEELQAAPARAPRTALWLKQWGQTIAQLRAST